MAFHRFVKPHLTRYILLCYGLCLLAQLGGSYFTALTVGGWYATLEKSPLTPPGYVFGLVWTMLYILMAAAAGRVCSAYGHMRSVAFRWWLAQLALGFLWCVVFFGGKLILPGLLVILVNLWAVWATYRRFRVIDPIAGRLMIPLLLWVGFASFLNAYIAAHN